MRFDDYSNFFNLIFLGTAALTLVASFRYLDQEGIQYPEYNLLVLFATLGMMLMVSALDLIVFFISLEILSLAVYVLVGFRRADRKSNEAAMKYFILGSLASALLLYGVALLYGATQTTQMSEVLLLIQAKPELMSPLFMLGVWFIGVGFLFKIAAVPFHMWLPDVYEGAPVPVTGFMTTGLKAAAFAAFVRVFIFLGYGKGLSFVFQNYLHDLLWVLAVLTMIIGNFIALSQTNLKRMLAYSSIAHTGYLLVGFLAAPLSEGGYFPIVLYLTAYALMNLGAFIVLTLLAGREDSGLNLHDLSGLSQTRPWLAFFMAVFMLSMAGVPPTAGFVGKYVMFYSAIQAREVLLVVISVLCSAVSVYYYLRVLVYMYMREPVEVLTPMPAQRRVWAPLTALLLVVCTLQIGVLPTKMVEVAKRVIASL
jgi:NADH-quinone oxidoreductase subunit N